LASFQKNFAISKVYSIVEINNLVQFNKGDAFKELIFKLNTMKVEAHLGRRTEATQTALLPNYLLSLKFFWDIL
jgi:hypothetical protein